MHELIALARAQLPAELTGEGAPPLGFVFDAVPEGASARGEKRKRIMIDNLEMEGNVGGHVNVMRNVRGPARMLAHTVMHALSHLYGCLKCTWEAHPQTPRCSDKM